MECESIRIQCLFCWMRRCDTSLSYVWRYKMKEQCYHLGGSSTAIKRIAVFLAIIFLFSFCTSCSDNHSPFKIEMELASDYDGAEPFVNEQLFYVIDDVDSIDFQAHLQMRSETCLLEIADNETQEVMIEIFWRESFTASGEDKEYITLIDLDKDREYVVRLICTGVETVKLALTSESSLVKVREQPQK